MPPVTSATPAHRSRCISGRNPNRVYRFPRPPRQTRKPRRTRRTRDRPPTRASLPAPRRRTALPRRRPRRVGPVTIGAPRRPLALCSPRSKAASPRATSSLPPSSPSPSSCWWRCRCAFWSARCAGASGFRRCSSPAAIARGHGSRRILETRWQPHPSTHGWPGPFRWLPRLPSS